MIFVVLEGTESPKMNESVVIPVVTAIPVTVLNPTIKSALNDLPETIVSPIPIGSASTPINVEFGV